MISLQTRRRIVTKRDTNQRVQRAPEPTQHFNEELVVISGRRGSGPQHVTQDNIVNAVAEEECERRSRNTSEGGRPVASNETVERLRLAHLRAI